MGFEAGERSMPGMERRQMPGDWIDACAELLNAGGEEGGEGALFLSLARLFDFLSSKEGFRRTYPPFMKMLGQVPDLVAGGDRESVEESLTMLYAALHGGDSSYTGEERAALDARGGYWCHAGGLSPLWRARPYIGAPTRTADYGAGNGFQGLLLQHLYPHRLTTQIELSGAMIDEGRALQEMMGIPAERVEWIHGSVETVSPRSFDFIYIYRPMKPGRSAGKKFYRWFAEELADVGHDVTIFSIADCLKDFLDPRRFTLFYDDGQLTCFSGGGGKRPGGN